MAGFPGWGVDPNRREEYYFSKQEQRWIYRSEEKIQESGNTTREQKNSISASERNDDESINEGMKYVYLGKSRPLRDGDEDSDESVNIGSRSHGFSKGESNPKRATFRYPGESFSSWFTVPKSFGKLNAESMGVNGLARQAPPIE